MLMDSGSRGQVGKKGVYIKAAMEVSLRRFTIIAPSMKDAVNCFKGKIYSCQYPPHLTDLTYLIDICSAKISCEVFQGYVSERVSLLAQMIRSQIGQEI